MLFPDEWHHARSSSLKGRTLWLIKIYRCPRFVTRPSYISTNTSQFGMAGTGGLTTSSTPGRSRATGSRWRTHGDITSEISSSSSSTRRNLTTPQPRILLRADALSWSTPPVICGGEGGKHRPATAGRAVIEHPRVCLACRARYSGMPRARAS